MEICSVCGKEHKYISKGRCFNCYYKEYYAKNKIKKCLQTQEYKKKNPDKVKSWWANTRDQNLVRLKKLHIRERDKHLVSYKKYYQENKPAIMKKRIEYDYYKRHNDIQFRIKKNLAQRVRGALRKYSITRQDRTIDLIGCSLSKLKQHLESQFKEGMTWQNYGLWEIDHIKPCNRHNLLLREEQLLCFNYTNLQPLWELDNIRKYDKY